MMAGQRFVSKRVFTVDGVVHHAWCEGFVLFKPLCGMVVEVEKTLECQDSVTCIDCLVLHDRKT